MNDLAAPLDDTTLVWFTILHAEDGSYLKAHDDKDAAWAYVKDQMGDNPEPHFGGYVDDWGRRIAMIKASHQEAFDIYELYAE